MQLRRRKRPPHTRATWRADPVPPRKSRLINRNTPSAPVPVAPNPPAFPQPAPLPPQGVPCADCRRSWRENYPCCPGTDIPRERVPRQGELIVDDFPNFPQG